MADDKDGAGIFESRLPYSKSQGNSPTEDGVAQNGPFCRECSAAIPPVLVPQPPLPRTVAEHLEALGTVEVEPPEGGRYQIRGTGSGLRVRWWREDRNEWAKIWHEAGADLLTLPIVRPTPPPARSAEAEQWPYGPPDHHEECCLLHKGATYCDCKASDASDSEFGLGHASTSASPGSSGEAGKAEDPCALVNTRLDSW